MPRNKTDMIAPAIKFDVRDGSFASDTELVGIWNSRFLIGRVAICSHRRLISPNVEVKKKEAKIERNTGLTNGAYKKYLFEFIRLVREISEI